MGRICKECTKGASYGMKGENPSYCVKHKTAEMVDVLSRRCDYEDCDSITPIFGIKGELKRYCKIHKTEEMTDLKNKRCVYKDCKIITPSFNIKGLKGMYCVTHKTPEMINVKNKICEYTGCNKQPGFNIPGGKAKFCFEHKSSDMVDIRHDQCKFEGCNIRPTYNIKGKKPYYCTKHKTYDMVDVSHTYCNYTGCELRANYDIVGEKGKFCTKHKLEGMIHISSIKCIYKDCIITPSFDLPGGKGRFCAKHKTSDMINVKLKRCEYTDCPSRVHYGKPGHPRSHCAKHREAGMIRKSNSKCKKCKDLAIYGINWVPRHCEIHKTDEDENLVERPCSSCTLLYILNKENKCEHCDPTSFATARLAKQNALMDSLDVRGLKGSSTDTIIDEGICGKERPDRIFDFGDKIVILECDEHQHRDRACVCEQTRMINIGQSFGGLPVYFIRWNPDDYSPKNDKKDPELLSKRYKLVGDLLEDIQKDKVVLPTALVSAIYMYYDEWASLAEESWKVLTPFAD